MLAPDRDGLRLHIGTYARAGGLGLYPLAQAPGEQWQLGDPYQGARNASFGAYSRRFDLHYLVDEQVKGLVGAYRETPSGWQRLVRMPTHGAEPCYVALDSSEEWLAVANYGSGSTALFRLDPETGLPVEPPAVFANKGQGADPDRQEGPHAHCAQFAPAGNWLYQVDLGTDEILALPFGRLAGAHAHRTAFKAPPGSGPRHLVLYPGRPLAFLLSELASTVTALDGGDGTFSTRQRLSTLPDGFSGRSLAGHIALNAAGDRLYVSNRGHDSIAVYALDTARRLSPVQHVPSGGASPRFFLLCELQRTLIVAHEEDGIIAAFEIADDGLLTPRGAVARVPGAAFLF